MFTYASLLVQEKYFTKVEIFFLIVGHTHASIDQYFSVLSREILKTNFIGSPLSLEALLRKEGMGANRSGAGDTWKKDDDQENKKVKPLAVR